MISDASPKKLPITAYLNSKHGLLFSKAKTTSSDPIQLQLETLESQVKSNNQLTLTNTNDLKASKNLIENLTQRLDSCSTQIDQLTLETKESVNSVKRGQKRKWEEISQVVQEVDVELSGLESKIQNLESSITDLSIKISEIQETQKKKGHFISAAVGASAAIIVLSSFVLSPDLV